MLWLCVEAEVCENQYWQVTQGQEPREMYPHELTWQVGPEAGTGNREAKGRNMKAKGNKCKVQ